MARQGIHLSQAIPICLEVLGLAVGASEDELKRAHRALAVKHHPDKGGEQREFLRVQEAYEVLCKHGTTPPPAPQQVQFRVVYSYGYGVSTGTSTTGTGWTA